MPWSNPTQPNLPDFWLFIRGVMVIPPAALPGVLYPPAAPTLTPGTGGSLPDETVYVVVTYLSQYGETLPSPEVSVAVTGPSGQVTVASPTVQALIDSDPGNATGYNVYAGAVPGGETLQNTAPIAIGTNYVLGSLVAGVLPPTADTSGSPWPGYALAQAANLVIRVPYCGSGLDYTIATYNCAGHILLTIAPDVTDSRFFWTLRTEQPPKGYALGAFSAGMVTAASDQGTANTLTAPDWVAGLQIGDLEAMKTPYGRAYLSYNQAFGPDVVGLS